MLPIRVADPDRYTWGMTGAPHPSRVFSEVQVLTVHHTGMIGDRWDPDRYHLVIDGAGTVYPGGVAGRGPLFAGRRSERPQLAATTHVVGFDAGNLGVAMAGDFTAAPPTAAARSALVGALVTLFEVCRLDPLGRTRYVHPATGVTRTVPTLGGHRDWLATSCPGDAWYPLLAELREEVASRLGLL